MPSHQERRHRRYVCRTCGTSELDGTHNVQMDDGRIACLIAVSGKFKGAFIPVVPDLPRVAFPPTSRTIN